jgi:CRP/FNR family cyclic AMP-dependent transcriptional regulator
MGVNYLLLKNIELLKGVDETVLLRVSQFFTLKEYRRGEVVVRKGEQADSMAFVQDGTLQVVDLSPDGREVGLSFIETGSHFGEMSIIDGEARSASVVAIRPSKVLFMPRQEAMTMILENPIVSLRIMARLAQMVRRTSQQVAMLNNQAVHQRVCALLLELAKPMDDDVAIIPTLPSQKEIAIMVNASRETVSRSMATLIRQGYFEKISDSLRISPYSKFKEMATIN